jgi:hypothetical protein
MRPHHPIVLRRDAGKARARRKQASAPQATPQLLTLTKPYGKRPAGDTLVVHTPGMGRKPGIVDAVRAAKLIEAGIAVPAKPAPPPAQPAVAAPAPVATATSKPGGR